jgi:hypothetical protein
MLKKLFRKKREHEFVKKDESTFEYDSPSNQGADPKEQIDQNTCTHEWEYHFFNPDGYQACKKCGLVQ